MSVAILAQDSGSKPEFLSFPSLARYSMAWTTLATCTVRANDCDRTGPYNGTVKGTVPDGYGIFGPDTTQYGRTFTCHWQNGTANGPTHAKNLDGGVYEGIQEELSHWGNLLIGATGKGPGWQGVVKLTDKDGEVFFMRFKDGVHQGRASAGEYTAGPQVAIMLQQVAAAKATANTMQVDDRLLMGREPDPDKNLKMQNTLLAYDQIQSKTMRQVFHYCPEHIGSAIGQKGFRLECMSGIGMAGEGVYLSLKGPHQFGWPQYPWKQRVLETNYGASEAANPSRQACANCVVVAFIDARLLVPVPGREGAVCLPSSTPGDVGVYMEGGWQYVLKPGPSRAGGHIHAIFKLDG